MKLSYSHTSPYARKVMVLAIECGLDGMIDCVDIDVWDESSGFRVKNPLSKVPVLETDEGLMLFDSTVICAYLDTLHGGQRFIPVAEPAHWQVLRLQSLCDGILDAAFSSVMERRKRSPEQQSDFWISRYRQAIVSSVAWLEEHLEEFDSSENFAPICVGVALGYIGFRLPEINWRVLNPNLSRWFAEYEKRESMVRTNPSA